MSQFFSVARFGRLLRKHFAEHLLGYGLSASVLLGGILAVLGFLSYTGGGYGQSTQGMLYMMWMLLAGLHLTSTVLAEYGQGSRAALALTLPASHFEKYLVAWLVSGPLFLVVYTAAFYLADWLVLTLGGHADMLVNVWGAPGASTKLLTSFLLLHAVALWGSIFFRRQQFLRTGFMLLVLVVALIVVNSQVVRALLGIRLGITMPFSDVQVADGLHLSLPESQECWLLVVPVALVLLLWLAAYARFTEKQL